jgi:hypothetical protein
MAVAALAAWSRAGRPGGLEATLAEAAEVEARDDVREQMRRLLWGEPLSP